MSSNPDDLLAGIENLLRGINARLDKLEKQGAPVEIAVASGVKGDTPVKFDTAAPLVLTATKLDAMPVKELPVDEVPIDPIVTP